MTGTDEMKRRLAADANWLKGAYRVGKDLKARGFYGYGASPKSGWDRSTSQIAILGAWGCAQIADFFGEEYWRTIETAWRKPQPDHGSWNYSEGGHASEAMTAAGAANTSVTQDHCD